MKRIQVISTKEWQHGHPMDFGHDPSDKFYTKFCTELLRKINRAFTAFEVPQFEQRELALLIGHYVEDVVSRTHVFDSFRRLHEKMYGRKLPFYELDKDYNDDEINFQDIKFFIWNYYQRMYDDEIIDPDNEEIDQIAQDIFSMVCAAYIDAPEVEALHDYVFDKEHYTDFINSKKVLQWLLMGNPITAPDDIIEQIGDELQSIIFKKPSQDLGITFYSIWSQHLFLTPCNFLALRANEWLAEMLRAEGMTEEADKIATYRHTGMKDFEIMSIDEESIKVKDCETKEQYHLLKDSLNNNSPISTHQIIHCDLVSSDGKTWETNGMVIFTNEKPAKKRFTTDSKPAYDYYIKKLGGKRLVYYKNYDDLHKNLIGNAKGTIDDNILFDLKNTKGIVVFLNSDGSLNLSTTLAETLPDPENPYFKAIDKTFLLETICDEEIASLEMVQYFHQQGWLDDIAFSSSISPERGHELLHGNFDFILRYFRGAEYKTLEDK